MAVFILDPPPPEPEPEPPKGARRFTYRGKEVLVVPPRPDEDQRPQRAA